MTQRTSRLHHSAQFIRERSGRVRDRLRPQNLHAPSLDWLNFLIADVRGGLGPYVIVYLITEQGWSPTTTGLISTISGWLGLLAQGPIGAWLDRTGRKRAVMLWALLGLSCAVLVLAWAPGFWPVLVANSTIEVVSGVFEPAIAALTVGLCTRDVLTARMGRNAAWSRAGNVAAAVLSGLIAWLFSTRGVFLQVPVLAALAASVAMTIPYGKVDLRRARGLQPEDNEHRGPTGPLALLRNRRLLAFAACSFLYELADAPLLTLVGQKLGTDRPGTGMIFTSVLIIAYQLGYRLLLVIGFVMLPGRAVLTVLSGDPAYLVSIQLIGGIGTGLFVVLTPIWLADETQGTGRYNLAQGTMATMRSLGATASGLSSQLIVQHLGYPSAFSACGIIGAAAAVLLWRGLPPAKPSTEKHDRGGEGRGGLATQ
jgi:MFS family permease